MKNEILKLLDDEFDGEIHISLGMTDKEEERLIIKNLKNNKFIVQRDK